jgi:hypothetical protein
LAAFGPARPAAATTADPAIQEATAGSAVGLPDQPWLDLREQTLLDLDGDGGQDAMRLRGYWNAGRRLDTVTVYSTAGPLPSVADYRVALNYDSTTWVFDPQSRERAALIVRFAREEGRAVAYLWDDQDGDGGVAYEVDGRTVVVTESPFWTMKVWADGDWLREDGALNYNLNVLLDGCGECAAGGKTYPAPVIRAMATDGRPDFAFELIDADRDGVPEYRTRRILTPVSDGAYSLPFFFLNANEGRVVPDPPHRYTFWPLLPADAAPLPGNYFDRAPFIAMDWRRARLGSLTLPGYPIEQGYHLNSRAKIEPGHEPAYVDFENPMAYYDLAGDRDGLPELMVRFESYGPRDPHLLRGQSGVPQVDVRYSWNQTNADGPVWDYKLGLSGRHEIETTAEAGGFDLRIVPYPDVPTWVNERTWDVSTFVAVERENGYTSSEGIYEWAVNTTATRPYFAGLTSLGPTFDELPVGLRGEYSERPGRPEVYLDPVDGRLHLLRADGGFWNLGDGRALRYLNLDGGENLDGWQLWDNGALAAQLYRVPDGLLYSDPSGTFFREAAIPAELLRTAPPANHDAWAALGERLAADGDDGPGADLRRLFDRFSGPVAQVATGGASDVRLAADGFRAVVEADDPAAGDAIAALTGQPPGDGPRVVALAGGVWTASPARAALPAIEVRVESPAATLQTPVRVAVTDPGTVDLGPAVVELIAVDPRGREIPIDERELTFDANGAFAFGAGWAPTMRGDWRLTASVRRATLGPRGDRPPPSAR